MNLVGMTERSRNVKTGPMPVTTSSRSTCPDACPFKGNGCYADIGPLRLYWNKVSDGRAGLSWPVLLDKVRHLSKGTVWRHNQAGDLPGTGNVIDAEALEELVEANSGKRGFTYTHKPMDVGDNLEAVRKANANGFTINLSGNNPKHAAELAALNAGPVVTVLPIEYQRKYNKSGWVESVQEYRQRLKSLPETTPDGQLRIVVCPATAADDVSCLTCQLCQRQDRTAVVGFPAHGASKSKASKVAAAAWE